ncbi:MAG: hypothetical protein ABI488_20505 [Polyangiaceae bacterium]
MRNSAQALLWLGFSAASLAYWAQLPLAYAEPPTAAPPEPLGSERYRTPLPDAGAYWHGFGSLALGKGLRFNNPYRLSTPLGKTPESVSSTATYYDLGLGAVRGGPQGLAHGAVLHLSIAAEGIPQEVLSLSYIGLLRVGNGRGMLFGRAGIPVVLQPDLGGGLEAAFGAAFMISAGLGLQSEVVGSLFYGAGTLDRSVTTIPVLSAQLGLFIDYEVLP